MHPTEKAFQAALDADPSDAHTRMVFADWLDEQDDPRGPGYRELGRLGLRPCQWNPGQWTWNRDVHVAMGIATLPGRWFTAFHLTGVATGAYPYPPGYHEGITGPVASRKIAEDLAALAYAHV